jgi:hypothetical protein
LSVDLDVTIVFSLNVRVDIRSEDTAAEDVPQQLDLFGRGGPRAAGGAQLRHEAPDPLALVVSVLHAGALRSSAT